MREPPRLPRATRPLIDILHGFSQHEIDVAHALSKGFFLGVARGEQNYADLAVWRPFKDDFLRRATALTYQLVPKPIQALFDVPAIQVPLREAISAYLYGLPNAAAYCAGKALELGLRHLHQLAYPPKPGQEYRAPLLDALIGWWGAAHPDPKTLAAACNQFRNTIHRVEFLNEADGLNAIRDCCTVLSHAFPIHETGAPHFYICTGCQKLEIAIVRDQTAYRYGWTLPVVCDGCGAAQSPGVPIP